MNISTLPAVVTTGMTFTAAMWNALLSALSGYTIEVGDIGVPYARFAVPFRVTGTLASGTSAVMRLMVPSTDIFVPVQADLSFTTTIGGTLSFQFTDDGSNVLNATLTRSTAAGTPATSTSFAISSIAGGSLLVLTLSATTADIVDPCAVIHFKTLLKA